MTYVMSDLHGQYHKYLKMLDVIDFTDSDVMYVIGDVVDRGPQSVELLQDMSMRANVFPIIGNHDLTARMVLEKLCVEITEDNYENHLSPEVMDLLSLWLLDGGQSTLDSFKKLDADERGFLIEYLHEFSPYEKITVGGNRFILVHGGIPYEKRKMPLHKQSIYELAIERVDYSKRYFDKAYLVTGHTPTINIGEEYRGKIFKGNGHIAIDCGAGYGFPLGCIRLDDFKEFYVD